IIGQMVQKVKDNLPNDCGPGRWHNPSMPNDATSSAYKQQFLDRVKSLRESKTHEDGRQWTAEDMAIALGIPAERYRKYESRTLLPHELIEPFALIVGISAERLVARKDRPAKLSEQRVRRARDSRRAK